MLCRMDHGLRGLSRRGFIRLGASGGVALGFGLLGGATVVPAARAAGVADFGPLGPPDENGLRLPPGFRSRIVAETGKPVGGTDHRWHAAPDGGATFATEDGGWIYVSNSESGGGSGGAGAIRFAPDGTIRDAYPILSGTSRNCGGGPTPWGTWLSCEEQPAGRVWECDPTTKGPHGIVRPALGAFAHEAVAVDPIERCLYLTEDAPDGVLYRFTPTRYPDLSTGLLEAAEILDPGSDGPIAPGQARSLRWHPVADPSGAASATRHQVPKATHFLGGEGIWYADRRVVFSTKGDNRIWQIDLTSDRIEILYDLASTPSGPLSGVDNVFVAPTGDVYVAEDGGNMEIVAILPSGEARPIIQITGQPGSEVTGPALSPDGARLYFSSQDNPGITYEVTGPFVAPAPAA